MCLSISATVALACLFTPKVYLVLFQPYKNVRSGGGGGAAGNGANVRRGGHVTGVGMVGGAGHTSGVYSGNTNAQQLSSGSTQIASTGGPLTTVASSSGIQCITTSGEGFTTTTSAEHHRHSTMSTSSSSSGSLPEPIIAHESITMQSIQTESSQLQRTPTADDDDINDKLQFDVNLET